MNDLHNFKSPRYLSQILVVALTYFAFGRLGLLFDAVSGFATLVWVPTGISIAILFLFGRKFAPGVFLGALITNMAVGAIPIVAIIIGLGNMLEAYVGATFLKNMKFDPRLSKVQDVWSLIIPVAMISTLVSATIGVTALYFADIVTFSTYSHTWFAWWIGDMIGALVFAPLIFVWMNVIDGSEKLSSSKEGILPYMTLLAVNIIVFFNDSSLFEIDRSLFQSSVYPIFIPLIWLAFKEKQRAVVTGIFLTAVIAVWATILGEGPFAGNSISQSLLALQIFIGTLAVTIMFLSATISEKEDARKNLRTR